LGIFERLVIIFDGQVIIVDLAGGIFGLLRLPVCFFGQAIACLFRLVFLPGNTALRPKQKTNAEKNKK
jgi:hypothetical protein